MEDWKDCIIKIMRHYGGVVHLSTLYREFPGRFSGDLSRVNNLESQIRATIQSYSADASQYKHKGNYFRAVKEKGTGWWGLQPHVRGVALSSGSVKSQPPAERKPTSPVSPRTNWKVRLAEDNTIALPPGVRRALNVRAGEYIEVRVRQDGTVELRHVNK